jgi:hypothetical protein
MRVVIGEEGHVSSHDYLTVVVRFLGGDSRGT